MNDLQVNDTVKVIDPAASCYGETGTVRAVEQSHGAENAPTVYDVFFPHRNNGPVHFDRPQLEKVEE